MKNSKNIVVGVLATVGVVTALSYVGDCLVNISRSSEEPKRERYNANAVVVDPVFSEDGAGFVLVDEDKDGDLDLIRRANHPTEYVFIAPGHKTDGVPETGARELTPEELELANQMLNGGNEFSYKIAKARFDGSKKSE